MNRTYFRVRDSNPTCRIAVDFKDLKTFNDSKWGIYWSVNEFDDSGSHKKENIVKINSFFADLDGDKKRLLKVLSKITAHPSQIVETKNGYHLYWFSKDGQIENYREIQERILLHVPQADRLKDTTRMLRVPGYYHWKDENNPFLVKQISYTGKTYTENEMKSYFKGTKKESKKIENNEDYIPCREGLIILSGTDYVKGDIYSFKKNSNDTYQIIVNDKTTGCWIDEKNTIGSYDKGGPFLFQWLRWYDCEDIKKAIDHVKYTLLAIKSGEMSDLILKGELTC